jgi:hypothetical protein
MEHRASSLEQGAWSLMEPHGASWSDERRGSEAEAAAAGRRIRTTCYVGRDIGFAGWSPAGPDQEPLEPCFLEEAASNQLKRLMQMQGVGLGLAKLATGSAAPQPGAGPPAPLCLCAALRVRHSQMLGLWLLASFALVCRNHLMFSWPFFRRRRYPCFAKALVI